MKIKLILLASLFAVGFAMSATAGSVTDTDGDGVPDVFDNCLNVPNGPAETPNNQVDGDMDGYGNACDADFDNSGAVDGSDFTIFIGAFNSLDDVIDLTGDGVVDGNDFGPFIGLFNTVPGPSGLSCAGTIPCKP